jgi:hypothetical protein
VLAGDAAQVCGGHAELGGDVGERAVSVEILGSQPAFVDRDPLGPARWRGRYAVALQRTAESVLADVRPGPDGAEGALVVDDQLTESFGGELGGERVPDRRPSAG